MARFYGKLGYVESVEKEGQKGVWEDVPTERAYYGDILRNSRSNAQGETFTPGISVSTSVSVLSDDYLLSHLHFLRYAIIDGIHWGVTSVEYQRPRVILTLGAHYDGPTE